MKNAKPTSFSAGDKVRFLNEKGEGIITKILNSKMVSVQIGEGFEIPYDIDQLVHIKTASAPAPPPIEKKQEPADYKLSENDINRLMQYKEKPVKRHHSIRHAKNSGALEKEVDLHFGEFADKVKNKMSNGEIVVAQLALLQQELDAAIQNNFMKITFIHGIGNGRLKAEIIRVLNGYEGIRYHDAPYSRYGFGATEVIISNSARGKW